MFKEVCLGTIPQHPDLGPSLKSANDVPKSLGLGTILYELAGGAGWDKRWP